METNRYMVGIYRIKSPTGKVYIGQSWGLEKRIADYIRYNCKKQPKLYASLKKHGVDAHKIEVVHELPADVSQSVLDRHEQLYMDQYRSCGVELMNIREAGSSGKLSKESIRLIVEKRRANGSYVVKDHVRKMSSDRQKGKPLKGVTMEHRLKTAEKLRGRKQSEWHKEKNRQGQLGRKHSEETKRKIGDSKIGRKRPDVAERMRKAREAKPPKPPKEKKIREYKYRPMLPHVMEALREANNKRKGIQQSEAHRKARSEAIKEWWAKRKSAA